MMAKAKVKFTCAYCGKEGRRRTSDIRDTHNFCSRECYHKWQSISMIGDNNHRHISIEMSAKIRIFCCICGEDIYRYNAHMKEHNLCSRKCYALWRSLNTRGPRKKRGSKEKVNCNCKTCGIEFQRYRNGSTIPQYCSRRCSAIGRRGVKLGRRVTLTNTNEDEFYRKSFEMYEWRKNVYRRDNYICQMCHDSGGSGHKVVLNAHHIDPLRDNKEAMYKVDNGITLCVSCHKLTLRREKQYEEQFKLIVASKKYGCQIEVKEEQLCIVWEVR